MPASSAAASTVRPSAASRAKGFSHSTCLPAAMAARAMGAWVWGGVATVTASTPSRANGLVHRGEGPGYVEHGGPVRRLGRVAPDQGHHLEPGRPQGAHVGDAAEPGADHDHPGHRAASSTARVARAAAAPPRRPGGPGARRRTPPPRAGRSSRWRPVPGRGRPGRTRPSPGRARWWRVASTRLSSASSRSVVELDPEDQLAGTAASSARSVPERTRCQASTLSPPLGAPALATTSSAVARSGIFDHGSHSMWTRSPCSAARRTARRRPRRRRPRPGPAEDVDGVDRAATDGVGHREQLGLAEAEDVLAVVARGRYGCRPPPVATTRPGRARPRPGRGRRASTAGRRRSAPRPGRRRSRGPTARRRRSRRPAAAASRSAKVTCRGSVPEHSTRSSGPISSRPPCRRHRAARVPPGSGPGSR